MCSSTPQPLPTTKTVSASLYPRRYEARAHICSTATRNVSCTSMSLNVRRFAPRDVISKDMMKEQKETGSDKFYLDISYRDLDLYQKPLPYDI